MKLGTPKADRSIRDMVKAGYTLVQATATTKCDDAIIKQMLYCLFNHKTLYPNYVKGRGRRSKYGLWFDKVKQFLDDEKVPVFIGNSAPQGGQLGKFITVSKEKLERNSYPNILNYPEEME